jgi:hypothetical protein
MVMKYFSDKKNDQTLYQMVDKQNTPVSNGKVQLPWLKKYECQYKGPEPTQPFFPILKEIIQLPITNLFFQNHQ